MERFVVTLSQSERDELTEFTRKGSHQVYKVLNSQCVIPLSQIAAPASLHSFYSFGINGNDEQTSNLSSWLLVESK